MPPTLTRAEAALAVIAAAVGAVLRFVADSPLWLDESLTVNIASGDLGSITSLLRDDGHPPLFYLMESLWIDWFGSGDAAVRSLSGVLGLIVVALTGIVADRLFGRRTAAAAIVVVALSPFAVRYSTEARMYELILALVLIGLLLVERALEQPTARRLIPVSVCSGALLLTHYWSFFLLGAAFVLAAATAIRAPHADQRRGARLLAVAVAGGGIFFLPWLGGFLDQLGSTGTPWAPRPRPTVLLSETVLGLAGGLTPESILLGVLLGALWALALFTRRRGDDVVLGVTADPRLRRMAAVTAVTLALGAVVSFLGDSAFVARYAAVYLPLVLITVAAGIARIPHAVARVILLAAASTLGLAAIGHELRSDRTQAAVIAEAIRAESAPGDLVVYCPDQLGPATERSLGDASLDQYTYPELSDPRLVDWTDYAERHATSDPERFAAEVVQRTPPGARVFVVWSDGYRSVGTRCSGVVDALARAGTEARQLLTGDANRYFENASLHRIDGVSTTTDRDPNP